MAGAKRLRFRERALADVEAAAEWYAHEGGADLVDDFLEALEAAYDHLARNPATGLPRWAHALDLPGLRSWRLGRFPWLAFYVEVDERIEVWRVLHGARDIPSSFADAGEPETE
jgi:toxin ParE1/3/4